MILRGLLYGALGLLLLLLGSSWLLLATESGSLWLVSKLNTENIKVQGLRGSLLDKLQVELLDVSTPDVDISIRDLKLQINLLPLLLYRVSVENLEIGALTVTHHPQVAGADSAKFSGLPLFIDLPRISIRQIRYQRDDQAYVIDHLKAAGALFGLDVNLSQLSLDYQDFKLVGELQLRLSDPWPFTSTYRLQTPYGEFAAGIEGSRQSISLRGVFQSLAVVANLNLDAVQNPLIVTISAPAIDLGPYIGAASPLLGSSLRDLDVRIVTDFETYRLSGSGVLVASSLPALPVVATGQFSNGELALSNLEITLDQGRAALSGRYRLEGQAFQGALVLEELPLPLLKPLLPVAITNSITLLGQISTRAAISIIDGHIDLDLPNISGVVNQRALSGSARLSAKDLSDMILSVTMKLGDNQLATQLDMASQKAQLDFSGTQLSLIAPQLQGQMEVHGVVHHLLGNPILQGSVSAKNFEFNEIHLHALTATLSSADSDTHKLQLAVEALRVGDKRLGTLQADIQGSKQRQAGTLSWRLDDQAFETQVSNIVTAGTGFDHWLPLAGDLNFAGSSLALPWGTWRSIDPTSLQYAAGQIALGAPNCWREEQRGAVCVEQLSWAGGRFNIDARLDHLPLDVAQLPGIAAMKLVGDLGATLRLAGSLDKWQGEFGFSLPQTLLTWSDFEVDQVLLDITGQGEIDNYSVRGALKAQSGVEHQIEAKLQVNDVREPLTFAASATLDSQDVGLLAAVMPFVANGHGKARAVVEFAQALSGKITPTGQAKECSGASGTLAQDAVPLRRIKGQLTLGPGVEAMIPALNLEFSDIEFSAEASSECKIEFRGQARSGVGKVALAGNSSDLLATDRQVQARLLGEQFTVINRPELQMTVSPDLEFTVEGRQVRVTGTLRLDSGQVQDKALQIPVRQRSADVVIVNAEPVQPSGPIYELDLALTVGEQVRMIVYGLNAKVSGALRIRQSATRPRQVEGILNLNEGVFSRYGVEFQLERGRLIYSGSVTNPVVDVVARREIDSSEGQITVQLLMSGTASNLQSRLLASPAMSEADALSYLILGRPLSGSTGSDGTLLAGAALSFGLKKAVPITVEIQAKLGLDELSVTGKDVDTASVVAGKRVTRDVYLEYNYGLFSRIGGLLVNYQLSERLSLQAQSGTADSLELIYKF